MIKSRRIKKDVFVRLFIFTAVLFFINRNGFAQAPNLLFVPVVTGMNQPVDVVNAGDGTNRLFIACLPGNVRIVRLPGGTLDVANFLDIPDSTDNAGEGGLLSIAFHPDFENNRYFFVYYTTNSGDLRITRFQTMVGDPNQADETTGTVILTIPHPGQSNHNGAKLNFGPDGNLYFGTGDGGSGQDANAQDGTKLLGKMLRINVDNFTTPPYYTIPADNPYVASGTILHEIYNMGLRNPWRWSFDRLNGDMWIADVGQDVNEEINYTPLVSSAALNYGWRCYEGNDPYNTSGCGAMSTYFFPIHSYDHGLGYCVTGGYVYRAPEYHVLYGWYICADWGTPRAWLLKPDGLGGWIIANQSTAGAGSLVGFGEAENGALYVLSLFAGTLYKITTNSPYLPLVLQQFTAKAYTGYNELKWKTTSEKSISRYEIEFSTDGANYALAGGVNAANTQLENNYSLKHFISSFSKLFYRIKYINKDGIITYSDVITLDNIERTKIYPTLITGDHLNIMSGKPVEQVSFFAADGKIVFQSKLNNFSGSISLLLPRLQKGVYIVQLKLKDETLYEKVMIQQD